MQHNIYFALGTVWILNLHIKLICEKGKQNRRIPFF